MSDDLCSPAFHVDALNPQHRCFWHQPVIMEEKSLFFGLIRWKKEISFHEFLKLKQRDNKDAE